VAPNRSSAASGSTFSVIGGDVTITGNINASADLHIDGRVEGDITCNALVQGEGSEVHGSITAENVRLSGMVHGSIEARELVIEATARITGDVSYDSLSIAQGGSVEGKFQHRGQKARGQVLGPGEGPELAADQGEQVKRFAS
jgi:cytoskeletal protein CcmA (bactofilin family)